MQLKESKGGICPCMRGRLLLLPASKKLIDQVAERLIARGEIKPEVAAAVAAELERDGQ